VPNKTGERRPNGEFDGNLLGDLLGDMTLETSPSGAGSGAHCSSSVLTVGAAFIFARSAAISEMGGISPVGTVGAEGCAA